MSYQDTYVFGKLQYDTDGNAAVGGDTTKYVIIKFAGTTGVGSIKIIGDNIPGNFTNYTIGHTNLAGYNTASLPLLCANKADNPPDVNNSVTAGALELWQVITSATDTVQQNNNSAISFKNVNFQNVNFGGTECVFKNGGAGDVTAANVRTNFTNCSFVSANLGNVSLKFSSFAGCNMTGATLGGANLNGADFSNATGLLGLTLPVNGAGENNSLNIKLPSFSPIVIEANGGFDNRRLTYTAPTAVEVDGSLAGGALTATASPSNSIPAGAITINTTSNAITNANIDGNIGRLVPLNVLKLARAVGAVVNIQ